MECVTFSVKGELYVLEKSKIPDKSFLSVIINTSLCVNNAYILDIDKYDFTVIYDYLNSNITPSIDDLSIIDYFNIDKIHSYNLSTIIEEDMRKNMYITDDTKYKGYDYGLVHIDEIFWDKLEISRQNDPNLLFKSKSVQKDNWNNITDRLFQLKQYTDIKGVFIAGGCIFSILFGLPIKDIDIFLYDLTEQEAKDTIIKIKTMIEKSLIIDLTDIIKRKVEEIIKVSLSEQDYLDLIPIVSLLTKEKFHNFEILDDFLQSKDIYIDTHHYEFFNNIVANYNVSKCIRTANALTFTNLKSEYQIILRLYQTPSEVIHGFDVDSCCLGYDGDKILMTQRAYFSIKNGYNTVNFNRLSPSYETRLVKYGTRGMSIKIDNFTRNFINKEKLAEYFSENIPKVGQNIFTNYAHLSNLNGLDTLIYLEHHCENYQYKPRSMDTIDKLNHEKSDYCSYPFIYMGRQNGGNYVRTILNYLDESKHGYTDQSNIYMPLLNDITKHIITHINNPIDNPIDEDLDFANLIDVIYQFYFENPGSEKSEILKFMKILTNNIPKANKIWFLKGNFDDLEIILNIPDLIYKCLGSVRPWDFPQQVKFKTTNPGQQMTNTFHQIILENNDIWYNGLFYHH